LFGGAAVSNDTLPSVVRLGQSCSGVLLHSELVVYAAHCGASFDSVEWMGTTLPVKHCEVYPDFRSFDTDIAYCLLSDPADSIELIPPALGCEIDELTAGTPVTLVGYGLDAPDGSLGTKRVAEAAVDTIDAGILVEGSGVGTCLGDSGGPLFVRIETVGSEPSWRVAGILSAGAKGCSEGPAIYAPLWRFVPWLEERTSLDLSPCGTAEGKWHPTPDCRVGSMSCGSDCDDSTHSAWSDTCGKPFEPSSEDRIEPRITSLSSVAIKTDSNRKWQLRIAARASDEGWGLRTLEVTLTHPDGELVWSAATSATSLTRMVEVDSAGTYELHAVAWDFADHRVEATRAFSVEAHDLGGCSAARGSGRAAAPWTSVLVWTLVAVTAAWLLRRANAKKPRLLVPERRSALPGPARSR
jgi:hypothetical protein